MACRPAVMCSLCNNANLTHQKLVKRSRVDKRTLHRDRFNSPAYKAWTGKVVKKVEFGVSGAAPWHVHTCAVGLVEVQKDPEVWSEHHCY